MREYLTREGERRLQDLFNLPDLNGICQIWEAGVTANNAAHLESILNSVHLYEYSTAELESVGHLLVHSLDDELKKDRSMIRLWPRIVSFLRQNLPVHTKTISDWINLNAPRDGRPLISPHLISEFSDVPPEMPQADGLLAFGACTEADLHSLQESSGIRLPADYRLFLTNTNGGTFREAFCWLKEHDDVLTIKVLFGLHQPPEHDLMAVNRDRRKELPPKCLAIGRDEDENYLVLCDDAADGSIYYYDRVHRRDPSDTGERFIKLADSFSEFAASINR